MTAKQEAGRRFAAVQNALTRLHDGRIGAEQEGVPGVDDLAKAINTFRINAIEWRDCQICAAHGPNGDGDASHIDAQAALTAGELCGGCKAALHAS